MEHRARIRTSAGPEFDGRFVFEPAGFEQTKPEFAVSLHNHAASADIISHSIPCPCCTRRLFSAAHGAGSGATARFGSETSCRAIGPRRAARSSATFGAPATSALVWAAPSELLAARAPREPTDRVSVGALIGVDREVSARLGCDTVPASRSKVKHIRPDLDVALFEGSGKHVCRASRRTCEGRTGSRQVWGEARAFNPSKSRLRALATMLLLDLWM